VLGDIKIVGEDQLTVGRLDDAPFAAAISLVRDGAGTITGLTVSTVRTWSLPFVREVCA
jgi:hypothetical protein